MKNRLHVLRAESDWTQADLAKKLSVSRLAVIASETGRSEPSLYLAFKIALDMAEGLAYLHSRIPPLVHRDIRSPNIFVRTLRIIDHIHATSIAGA